MSAADDDKVIRLLRGGGGPPPPSEDDYGADPDAVPPAFSDEALALRFATQHADRLRYVALWGKWLIWDGVAWRKDETMHSFDLARHICRSAASECNKPKAATSIASARTVAAVEKLSKADRRHAATVAQWDTDPWLLNTPDGIVDLRSGDLSTHDPKHHMTKSTAITPFGECPLWMQFLATITNNNPQLQAYLQRASGYCLTGSIREHALFFAYGTGANGKGTFLNTITGILGDYAAVSNTETFTAQAGSRHLTELARLHGARLVVAQETEEGKHLAEARIKAITGGDPITANFMRQDHFTYNPQFKLFIAGNHKPNLRHVDQAIRRRFNLIPFDVQIPREERDEQLFDKLSNEWPGILQWMVDGCRDWLAERLAPPDIVRSATEGYFEEEDTFGQWLSECCRISAYSTGEAGALFRSWKAWSTAAGEPPSSQKRFSQALASRGFNPKKGTAGKRLFSGLDLIVPPSHHEVNDEPSGG